MDEEEIELEQTLNGVSKKSYINHLFYQNRWMTRTKYTSWKSRYKNWEKHSDMNKKCGRTLIKMLKRKFIFIFKFFCQPRIRSSTFWARAKEPTLSTPTKGWYNLGLTRDDRQANWMAPGGKIWGIYGHRNGISRLAFQN